MHRRDPSLNRLLTVCTILFASATAAAAQTAAAPPAPGWASHGAPSRWPQAWQAERTKVWERRLAELHAKLNLQPRQEPAWQAFVTGLQAARSAPKPDEARSWEAMKMETAPDRLDHMLARIDEMRARLAQIDQTVKTFFTGLSKDQQTIFDDNFRLMRHRGGGPGGWKRHGMVHGEMDSGGMDRRGMAPPGMGSPGMGPHDMGAPPALGMALPTPQM